MPDELIVEIFKHADEAFNVNGEGRRTPYVITIPVCRKIWHLLRNTSSFYGNLAYKLGDDLLGFEELLRRSGNTLFNMKLEIDTGAYLTREGGAPDPSPVIEIIGAHMKRCRSLELRVSSPMDWVHLSYKLAPKLTRLVIHDMHDTFFLFARVFTPNLRYLTVDSADGDWKNLLVPSLIAITSQNMLLPSVKSFTQYLPNATNLQYLHISAPLGRFTMSETVTLPHLQELIISGRRSHIPSMLRFITAPTLARLGLHGSSWSNYRLGVLNRFLTVRHLEIWNFPPQDAERWVTISSMVPNITHLSTNTSMAFLAGVFRIDTPPFPNLTHVVVGEMSGQQASEFVAARASSRLTQPLVDLCTMRFIGTGIPCVEIDKWCVSIRLVSFTPRDGMFFY